MGNVRKKQNVIITPDQQITCREMYGTEGWITGL